MDPCRPRAPRQAGRAMKRLLAFCILTFGLAALCAPAREARRSPQAHVTIAARRYAFAPARVEVKQGNELRITVVAEDIAHSFVIDALRVEKRAAPGRPVTFEILADRAGTFPFYCNLTTEDGCRQMKGELVVR